MLRFILQRLLLALASFIGVTFLLWWVGVSFHAHHTFQLSGDSWGAYQRWLLGFTKGNWGSKVTRNGVQPLLPLFQAGALPTLLLLIPAFLLQQLLVFGLGVYAAVFAQWGGTRVYLAITYLFTSAPIFLLSLLSIEYIAVLTHWLPGFGLVDLHLTGSPYGTPFFWAYFHAHPLDESLDMARHLVLPITMLALGSFPSDSLIVRASMLEVLSQDYIRSARAHGIPRRLITWKHAFRNGLIPIFAQLSTQLPRLFILGAVVEYVFALPGIGQLFGIAVVSFPAETASGGAIIQPVRDIATVLPFMLIFVTLTIASSFVTELFYVFADPRIR